ncbi:hypothetical protein L6267_00650, partial [Candidatus Parcubacteria bacterium]|nr:hypothetical protein [Candidatus Parcubacteria bacterium]
MKNCQEKNNKIKQKKQFKRFNRKISIFLIFCFCLNFVFAPIKAEGWDSNLALDFTRSGTGMEIFVADAQVKLESAFNWLKKFTIDEALNIWEEKGDIAYKAMLSNFVNTLAYDTATYLATGDKGQSPMFETDDISDYLVNAADNAAGIFLEKLGQGGTLQFNLCEPDFNVLSKINLGLYKHVRPSEPECSFSKMIENWDEELSDPDFLPKFQDMFNPWSNDLGIALSLQTGMTKEIEIFKDNALYRYPIYPEFKPVKEPISGKNKSPAATSKKAHDLALEESTETEKTYTGSLAADAISIFVNTLIGKLIEEWLKEGIVTDFPDNSYKGDWGGFADTEDQLSTSGIAGAEERFRVFLEPDFNIRGDYDILSELTMCPDPDKAGPTNCVIDDNFKEAIINRLTVAEAIEQGYLNGSYTFGFQDNSREPEQGYMGSYPYRSMPILRKFRIIPVGWEEAALKIFDNRNEPITLDDIVACHSETDDYGEFSESWCRGLVDPNWVLKAPLNYCKREGPGPEIISTQVMGEEENSQISILRNSNYCADEQSCIKEKDDGSCEYYGYCTEERRTWRFDSESCEPKYNTCETFRNSEGQTASYLANSLDYGICNADNVGCQAYCTDFDYSADDWTCSQATGDKLYFDKDAKECDEDDEGCHEFIRTKAGLGANLLTNSSFEDDLAGTIWESDGVRVNDGYFGYYGMQLSANLSKPIAIGPADYSISGETYSLSFYAKDCSAGDNFKINGQAVSADLNSGSDWQYYQTAHIFPESSFGNVVTFEINSNICVIDAIKLERSIGLAATVYTDYRGTGVVYEKLLPDYLESACYENPGLDYAFKSGAPAECYSFARQCNKEEVGCELYTSVSDRAEVPAKVNAWDYCPSECVGYDAYIQQETIFDSTRNSYFIPETARTCGAETAGCDEFTNLDEVELGGEAREYYIYLRQCVKPSDPAANCSEFYTWEGSDESGFQLKVFNLQTEGIGVAS